jgi:hypothetical protein
MKGWLISILLVFLILGGGLRLYMLGSQSYWMDEGYTINAVTAIERTGTDILPSGVAYSCPLYCRPTAWIASEFGNTAADYRLLAALAGIAFIVVIYVIAADLFSPTVGILTSFFTAFSYFQIAWSRQARWYTLFELFFWLAIYFFYKFWHGEKRRVLYGVLTALFTLAAALTHGLGLILPLIFLLWIGIDLVLFSKRLRVQDLIPALGALVLILIFAYPAIQSLIGGLSLHYEFPYYASFYFRSYWLLMLLALVLLWRIPLAYRRVTLYLLFVILCYLVPLSLLTNIVQYRYLFHLTPALFMLGAVGSIELVSLCPRFYQKVLVCVVVIILFFATSEGVLISHSSYYLESDNPSTLPGRSSYLYVPQPNWNGAYAYISSHLTPDDIVISSMPQFNPIFLNEPGYWIEYSYLGLASKNPRVVNGHEEYADALVIPNLASLASTTASSHGYLVLDYMAEGRIDPDELTYIQTHFKQVFYQFTNDYSQIWVYQF